MVSFCIKLYIMNFCNRKKPKSVRRYLQTLNSCRPLLLPLGVPGPGSVLFSHRVPSNAGKPCSLNTALPTPHFARNVIRQLEALTFCNKSLWGGGLAAITFIVSTNSYFKNKIKP